MNSNELNAALSPLLHKLEQIDHLLVKITSTLKNLPVLTAEETALHVVGESYARWDSTANYLPTLCFLFRESTHQAENLKYRRKAQVKVRIKHRGQDLNDQIVNQLRQQCSSLDQLSFQHGTVRCNYVSPDRNFKTTVFANHQDQAVNVLQPICQIIQQPFDPAFLSVTSQRHRTSPTKRIQPLDGVPLNPQNYTDSFTLQLFKVILLVNGLKKPILISKFSG